MTDNYTKLAMEDLGKVLAERGLQAHLGLKKEDPIKVLQDNNQAKGPSAPVPSGSRVERALSSGLLGRSSAELELLQERTRLCGWKPSGASLRMRMSKRRCSVNMNLKYSG